MFELAILMCFLILRASSTDPEPSSNTGQPRQWRLTGAAAHYVLPRVKRSKRVCHQDVCLHAPLGAPARSTLRESESGAPPLVTFAWPRKGK